jgi:hypothetical protein
MKQKGEIRLITLLNNPKKYFISGENFAHIRMNRNPTFYPVELWAHYRNLALILKNKDFCPLPNLANLFRLKNPLNDLLITYFSLRSLWISLIINKASRMII